MMVVVGQIMPMMVEKMMSAAVEKMTMVAGVGKMMPIVE
jgi:hypothetical protein